MEYRHGQNTVISCYELFVHDAHSAKGDDNVIQYIDDCAGGEIGQHRRIEKDKDKGCGGSTKAE